MKHIYLFIIIVSVLLILNLPCFAQRMFKGIITYSIIYPDSLTKLNTNLAKEMVLYIDKNFTKTVILSKTGNSTIITNLEKSTSVLLLEIDQKKLAISSSLQDKSNVVTSQVIVKKETKKVAGYTCRKALIYKGGKTLTAYYSILFQAPSFSIFEGFDGIEGLLLEFSQLVNNVKVTYIAKTIQPCSFKASDFEIAKDYQQISQSDMVKLLKH